MIIDQPKKDPGMQGLEYVFGTFLGSGDPGPLSPDKSLEDEFYRSDKSRGVGDRGIFSREAFNSWLATRTANQVQHAEYLKKLKETPGRAGTIIAPTAPGKTILG